MAATQHRQETVEEELEDGAKHFIHSEDVLTEIPDDGNEQPMEEDDDDDELEMDMNGAPIQEDQTEDTSEQTFSSHNGSVFTISAHPSTHIAASGGEDDVGYLWDLVDGEIISKLTGHTDSVTSTAFSSDGEMIATGGMDGKVRLWRRVGNTDHRIWEFLTELQGPDEVMWLRWHPKGTVLLAGSNDSTVWLWQLPSGSTMQVFAGHTGSVNCGDFTPDGKRIVTACSDGTLMLWDPRSPTPIFKLSSQDARFDVGGITSLAINPASSLAVIGGSEGGVRVVSLSKGEVVGALGGHSESESVEAVQFVDLGATGSGSGVVVTGATDGKACIWDLNTMRLRSVMEHKDAVTSLLAHPSPKGYLIVSGSADGVLRTWDARTGTMIREHLGHQGPINSAALGMAGDVVLSAGDDGLCLVFTTTE